MGRIADDRDTSVGTAIKHSIGVWPAVVDDETASLECLPERELVLLANIGPVGGAKVTLRLSDTADGCRVGMSEVPATGPMSLAPDRLAQMAMNVRNRECLWRP